MLEVGLVQGVDDVDNGPKRRDLLSQIKVLMV